MIPLLCITIACLLAGFYIMTLAELENDIFNQLIVMWSGAMLFVFGFIGLPVTIFIYFDNFGYIATIGMILLYVILCKMQFKLLKFLENNLK